MQCFNGKVPRPSSFLLKEADSPMTRVKKILNSPLTRRKFLAGNPTARSTSGRFGELRSIRPYFGVALSTVLGRELSSVPLLVVDVCAEIERRGLAHEGLFRVNGNSRQLELLRREYDRYGQCRLEVVTDVMTVASLLKLYLRELPEAVIPDPLARQLIAVLQTTSGGHDERPPEDGVGVNRLLAVRRLLTKLDDPNRCLLGFLCCFLRRVAREERRNRMNASSLATVFGPNLFRFSNCEDDFKLQTCANKVIAALIEHHELLQRAGSYAAGRHDAPGEPSCDSLRMISPPLRPPPSLRPAESQTLTLASNFLSQSSCTQVLPRHILQSTIKQSNKASEIEAMRATTTFCSSVPFINDNLNRDTVLHDRKIVEEECLVGGNGLLHYTGELTEDATSIESFNDRCLHPVFEEKNSHAANEKSSGVDQTKETADSSIWRTKLEKFHDGVLETAGCDLTSVEGENTETFSTLEPLQTISGNSSDDSGFGSICRKSAVLSSFLRPIGPKNRRMPSRNMIRWGPELALQTEESTESIFYDERKDSSSGKAENDALMLDLSILHRHGDGSESIKINEAFHVTPFRVQHQLFDDQETMVSPQISSCNQGLLHNLDLPPSPPTDQKQFYIRRTTTIQEDIKHMNRKFSYFKKKFKEFEEEFETVHGYKPSHTDKSTIPELKKSLLELNLVRKELKKLKEDDEIFRPVEAEKDHKDHNDLLMKENLKIIQTKLEEKRTVVGRPITLSKMSQEQIAEEKLCIQKALLQFEGLHGRPATKLQREIMKPLYDRYRNVKKLLSKPALPDDGLLDLQSVPEDQAIDFTVQSNSAQSVEGDANELCDKSKQSRHEILLSEKKLHEMSHSQLLELHRNTRNLKKKLFRSLKTSEEQLTSEQARNLRSTERLQLQLEYDEYKRVKSYLKLLDILLSKHRQCSDE